MEVSFSGGTDSSEAGLTLFFEAEAVAANGGGVNMGPLPAAGSWARMEVPLSQLHLEGYTLIKMDINYRDGQVWFDRFGKSGSHPPAVLTSFTAESEERVRALAA